MAKIWDREKKCWVSVKSLKDLTFRSTPGFKFFVSKAYKEPGFVVTEETTGARVTSPQKSKIAAIRGAKEWLKSIGLESFQRAVDIAMKER